jgi:pimeloyl-ACP methyl ester carboxylesterase
VRLLSRWGFLTLVGGLVVLLAGGVALARKARPRLWFLYATTPLSPAGYDQLAARTGWAKSRLAMGDGTSLSGLVSRPAAADAPWVVFFPGNDATQLARGQLLLERIRGDHAWGLAVYASRGYDASEGIPSPAASAADASEVLSALMRQYQLLPAQLHLVAFSLGGYSALHAMKDAAQQSRPLASVSLLASVARIAMVHAGFWGKFGAGDVYDVLPILPQVPGPVLIVQGDADEAFGDVGQGRQLAEGLGERGRYVQLEGAGHSSLLENDAAISAARAMIEAHSTLGQPAAPRSPAKSAAAEAGRP